MYGYHPVQFTPGLWTHVWRPVKFTLVVDDFGVKFEGLYHANHLKTTLERWYDITVDWEGSKYVGINLKWDYDKGHWIQVSQGMWAQSWINLATSLQQSLSIRQQLHNQ